MVKNVIIKECEKKDQSVGVREQKNQIKHSCNRKIDDEPFCESKRMSSTSLTLFEERNTYMAKKRLKIRFKSEDYGWLMSRAEGWLRMKTKFHIVQ